ncbi:hypothetical protein [Oceanicoccus sagamiensis]|uniref:PEP-CTERM protein-sorting domain-containing protein n=1 Tax=Oceanicoccus sagamiensis TaxID=716816 RepID=A0A1X9ND36_9GAMM|nr:hypothetical protein [Oceanicoccus sagamiensis]ARN74964.1 hypothetical protein BST96_13065 [Oceanicoccus sagamiensis]
MNKKIKSALPSKLLMASMLLATASMAQAATVTVTLFLSATEGGVPLVSFDPFGTSSNLVYDDAAFNSGTAGSVIADSYYIDYVDGVGAPVPGEYIDESFGDATIYHDGLGNMVSLDLTVVIDASNTINVELDPILSGDKEWHGHFEIAPTAVPVPGAVVMFSSALVGLFGARKLRKS